MHQISFSSRADGRADEGHRPLRLSYAVLSPQFCFSFLKFFGSAEDFFTKKSSALCNIVLQTPIYRIVYKKKAVLRQLFLILQAQGAFPLL